MFSSAGLILQLNRLLLDCENPVSHRFLLCVHSKRHIELFLPLSRSYRSESASDEFPVILHCFYTGICQRIRADFVPVFKRSTGRCRVCILHASKALEKKVAFVPGEPFSINIHNANIMRLNYTNADCETIREGIRRVGELIREEMKHGD